MMEYLETIETDDDKKAREAAQNEQSVHKVNMSRIWTHCEL